VTTETPVTDAFPEPAEPAEPAEPGPPGEPARPPRSLPRPLPPWLDRAERIAGLVVATALGGVTGVYEAFLTPSYWHGYRVPAALVLAIVLNAALAWFTNEITGTPMAVLLPAGVWVAVMLTASGRTTEGDLVLTSNNWVGLATMFAGALAFAVSVYWLVTRTALRKRVSAR
jgi:hypothetical protein